MKRCFVALVVLAGTLIWAQQSFYEAYNEGIDHFKKAEWQEAEPHFLRALELRPKPGKRVKTYGLNFIQYDPFFYLASIHVNLGHVEQAQTYLDQSIQAQVLSSKQLDDIKTRLSELRLAVAKSKQENRAAEQAETKVKEEPGTQASPEDKVIPNKQPQGVQKGGSENQKKPVASPDGLISIHSSPPGARVFVDGKVHGETPLDLHLDLGDHDLVVRKKGYQSQNRALQVRRGNSEVLEFNLISTKDLAAEKQDVKTPLQTQAEPVGKAEPEKMPDSASSGREATVGDQGSHTEAENLGVETKPPVSQAKPEDLKGSQMMESSHKSLQDVPDEGPGEQPLMPWLIGGVLLVLVFLGWFLIGRSKRKPPQSMTLGETVQIGFGRTTQVDLVIGAYRLTTLLGQGNMGSTFFAEKGTDQGQYAVKVLHNHLLQDTDIRKRFIREGELGTTLHHPHIIRIFEAGQDHTIPYFVMEYLEGKTLEDVLNPDKKIDLPMAFKLTREIASALDYAHLKGVVHRDLKPENLMLLKDGHIKVMDFGIAKLSDASQTSATQSFIGTPAYSAPELMTPEKIGPESDLYSLGIILYRMLSGKVPFQGRNPLDVLRQHMSDPLPRLDVVDTMDPQVWQLILKLTAKNPAERYPSAEGLINDIDTISKSLS